MPDFEDVALWGGICAAVAGLVLVAIDAERHEGIVALLGLVFATGAGFVAAHYTDGSVLASLAIGAGAGAGYFTVVQRSKNGKL